MKRALLEITLSGYAENQSYGMPSFTAVYYYFFLGYCSTLVTLLGIVFFCIFFFIWADHNWKSDVELIYTKSRKEVPRAFVVTLMYQH